MVKKVLSIGIFFGIVVFGLQSVSAQVDRYNCSRFGPLAQGDLATDLNGKIGQCRLSNKCHVEGETPGSSYDEAADSTKTKWRCILDPEDAIDLAADNAESECEKTKIEYQDDSRFTGGIYPSTLAQLYATCSQLGQSGTEDECEERLNPRQNDDSLVRSLYRKFKRACKDDVQNRLENAENAFNTEQAQEYAPFGVYDGPSFGGPGLKAGSRIAKSKLDNTISKEKSIKKLAIGWVNLALSLVAILAVIAVIYAGVLYITSMGDDGNKDKAKNIIIYVALGILLIFGSYAIVQALLTVNTGNVSIT